MTLQSRHKNACAMLTAAALLQPAALMAQESAGDVAIAPKSSDMVQRYATKMDRQPVLTTAQKIDLRRRR